MHEIFSGKIDETIWGCRHKLRGSKHSCYFYINNDSKYVADKYEPIDHKMCVRLNNIMQLKELRRYFFEKYNLTIQKQYNHLVKMKNRHTVSLFQHFKLELYKIKVLNKTIEFKLDKISTGLTSLLVYRV